MKPPSRSPIAAWPRRPARVRCRSSAMRQIISGPGDCLRRATLLGSAHIRRVEILVVRGPSAAPPCERERSIMQKRNRFGRNAATVAVCIVALGLAQSASAHVDSPTVTALHAFAGDPLWGLDTPEGSLYGILPDERTAMASTTKVMTLDLAVEALNAGV